jgi:23S rRNA pseudouridine1911/1915/1917 synthase
MKLDVLFEDNHCLAVNKPAGLLSQSDGSGHPSVVELVKADLKSRYGKPGNVYVGLLHRLDRPASGVLLLAKTSKAARRLSAQFRAGSIAKLYWAIVEGRPGHREGEWNDALAKDRDVNRAVVVGESDPRGKPARMTFRILARFGRHSKLELLPVTGRSHQLRVQLAKRGLPIVGDRKYGAATRLWAQDGHERIALHARKLTFMHPTRGEAISVEAPVQADWPESLPGWSERRRGSSKPGGGSSP